MSRENVEIARQMIECVNRADDEGLAALMAEDVECFPGDEQPEPPFRGREAFLRYARSWTEAFDQYVVESCEYLDFGEYVVIVGRTVGRGRGSGVEVSSHDAWVLRFRDGRAVEYRECETKTQALEAVGLSEWAISQENVEVVRRTMDAYNTRDLPAYFDLLSESVSFQSRFSAMGRVYRGHDDVRRYFAELDEVWSRYEMRVLRLVPAGPQVAALCHLYAVGRESDLQVEENSAIVFTLEGGKIVRIDAYPTHAEALDAAGLRE